MVLEGVRVIAIIRTDGGDVVRVGRELAAEGVTALEVTLTTPGCLDAVAVLRRDLDGRCAVGVGTVRSAEQAASAQAAGAQFLVTPTVSAAVLAEAGVPVVCGALTPTEIDTAWSGGAVAVKLFPASLGGPRYLREVRAPLPDVPLIPTGGVTADIVGEYAAAGAVAIAVGSAIVSSDLVASGDWAGLRARARSFLDAAARGWPDAH